MNKLFTNLLLPISALFIFNATAQEVNYKCGLTHELEKLYKEDPSLEKDQQEFLLNAKKRNFQKGEKSTTVYTIPVVFHIIHEYGSENISDAQVMTQMDILNADYRLLNSDKNLIVSAFDTVAADIFLEFKLATKDPYGNCTNGIDHIYSHETNKGDDFSKLNQWHRSQYLNVWVVRSMRQGVAGYAFYPSATTGAGFFRDGINIINSHIGNIGTGSDYNSRSLTHEIGHYLGLPHPWGNTNDPGVQCGDDGIDDTPTTMGFSSCNMNNTAVCTPGIEENIQNYMEYSFCSYMFTRDQRGAMRTSLETPIAGRNNLVAAANHTATGIDVTSPVVCTPQPDFYASDRFVCAGSSVQFFDASWRASVTSRTWTFEGGTPATSTSANPSVTYDTQGYKKVTLTVTNATGTEELVQDQYIYVSENWADYVGPKTLDLEDDKNNWFAIENLEDNFASFQTSEGTGYGKSKSFKLNNYKDVSNALPYTDDFYYYSRMGGRVDALITPSFDLSHTTQVKLKFKYAYATNGTIVTSSGPDEADVTEVVNIYVSKNCGDIWSLRKTISGGELLTAGFAGGSEFTPANDSQWETGFTLSYSPTSTDTKTRFKIEFVASDYSNNFYVDDIQVEGVLGIIPNEINDLELSVYPNPLNSSEQINISYKANNNPVELTLRNTQGQVVYTNTITTTNAQVNETLELETKLSSSCYFLEVKNGEYKTIKKVVVL